MIELDRKRFSIRVDIINLLVDNSKFSLSLYIQNVGEIKERFYACNYTNDLIKISVPKQFERSQLSNWKWRPTRPCSIHQQ